MPDVVENMVLDDVLHDEIDDLDVKLAAQDMNRGPIAGCSLTLALQGMAEAQTIDAFSQTVVSRHSKSLDSMQFEDQQLLLRWKHRTNASRSQLVLLESSRPRLLRLTQYAKLGRLYKAGGSPQPDQDV